jgi:hypothetical protein
MSAKTQQSESTPIAKQTAIKQKEFKGFWKWPLIVLLCFHKITCSRVFHFCRIEAKVISEKKTVPITRQTTIKHLK